MLWQTWQYKVTFVSKWCVWRREGKMWGVFPFLKAGQTFHVPWKDKREEKVGNVWTGSVYTGTALQLPKLSNGLEHRKREQRAPCSRPSKLLLKHMISTTCSGIKAKVKGGEDREQHPQRAPYATFISWQKAGKWRSFPSEKPREMWTVGRQVRERKSRAAWQKEPAAGLGTSCDAGWKTQKSLANIIHGTELPQPQFKMSKKIHLLLLHLPTDKHTNEPGWSYLHRKQCAIYQMPCMRGK